MPCNIPVSYTHLRFEEQIAKNGLDKEVKVVRTGCFGLCEAGPVVIVYPEGTFYSRIRPDDVDEIVSEHLLKGRIVQHLVYNCLLYTSPSPCWKSTACWPSPHHRRWHGQDAPRPRGLT